MLERVHLAHPSSQRKKKITWGRRRSFTEGTHTHKRASSPYIAKLPLFRIWIDVAKEGEDTNDGEQKSTEKEGWRRRGTWSSLGGLKQLSFTLLTTSLPWVETGWRETIVAAVVRRFDGDESPVRAHPEMEERGWRGRPRWSLAWR